MALKEKIVFCIPGMLGVLLIILSSDVIFAGKTPLYEYNCTSSRDTILNGTEDSHQKVLKRDKRYYLIWNGISKVRKPEEIATSFLNQTSFFLQSVLGMLMPVETRDRVNWRTLNMAHNFQAQYMVLPRIVFPWNSFARALDEQKRKYEKDGSFVQDGSRAIVYAILEKVMDAKSQNGRECLLKAICEAQTKPIHRRSVFDEIVHIALT